MGCLTRGHQVAWLEDDEFPYPTEVNEGSYAGSVFENLSEEEVPSPLEETGVSKCSQLCRNGSSA